MEEKIRAVLKILLWAVFGGTAIFGVFMIGNDALHDTSQFNREVGFLCSTIFGYVILALVIWGVLYLIERSWQILKRKREGRRP